MIIRVTSILGLVAAAICTGQEQRFAVEKKLAIEWQGGKPHGRISSSDGTVSELKAIAGEPTFRPGGEFTCPREGRCRIEFLARGTDIVSGTGSTLVTVQADPHSFSFFLRNVNGRFPIYIPLYGVMVLEAADTRSWDEITAANRKRGLRSDVQELQNTSEETFEDAARHTREIKCQTWLGLSRDFRVFGLSERLDWIEPRFHAYKISLPETNDKPFRYSFLMGRGYGPADRITRRLEDGALPILHGTLLDGDVQYKLTAFTTLERSVLRAENLRGTHYLVGEGYGFTDNIVLPAPAGMRPWTDEMKQLFASVLPEEMDQKEETVLMMRIEMTNLGRTPRYGWFRNVVPAPAPGRTYESKTGFGVAKSGRVFTISKLNGKPIPADEVALLLMPGEFATIDVSVPHRPITRQRAEQLSEMDFGRLQRECRDFWAAKLASGGQIQVPEKRIDEMIRAGLLHLDLILYGREPKGSIAASVGVYTPIGSESSPIIQFLDSMGWHDVARRSLMFFLDKQHPDGRMQNYGDYQIETAGALYTMGEHYRYTRDDNWVRQIEPKVLKSCDYILRWRQRNMREDLRGKGYGMMDGKVGDPQDQFHSFMFNSYHYVALKRVAEMLARVDPKESKRLGDEAQAFRKDIRTAFFDALAKSPVMPLGDGTWVSTAPPWAEYRGALALYADGGLWYTHGALNVRESVAGPLWLVAQEVLDPNETATEMLLNFHQELLMERSAAFSQPYYSQHQFIHLMRGEPEAFIDSYYNTLTPMADRETYSFFEHYMGGPHKTHEEGQFLMQTRYMLYLERGDTLNLLAGVPRAYLKPGKRISLKNVATYFGPLSVEVEAKSDQITAVVDCASDRRPSRIELRLPHPDRRVPIRVRGGTYDPKREIVTIAPFSGRAEVVAEFERIAN